MQKERIITFDVMRVLAAFAVILLHVSSQFWSDSFPSMAWEARNVYLSLVRWSIPLFVMISGALFLDASRPLNIRRLYTKNIFRILCAFLFWSFLFELYATGFDAGVKALFFNTLYGPDYLWFLKMLIGLYILIPILRAVVSDKRTEVYFLCFSLFTMFLIPMFFQFVGMVNEEWLRFFRNNYVTTELSDVFDFSGYFVLGHYLTIYPFSSRVRRIIFLLGVFSFICVAGVTSLYANLTSRPEGILYDYASPFALFETLAVFLFVQIHFCEISPTWRQRILSLSGCSFGIYLVHPLVMTPLDECLSVNSATFLPVLWIPLYAVLLFTVSYLIVKVLFYIPYVKKYFL